MFKHISLEISKKPKMGGSKDHKLDQIWSDNKCFSYFEWEIHLEARVSC